jgi:hypothetical protein
MLPDSTIVPNSLPPGLPTRSPTHQPDRSKPAPPLTTVPSWAQKSAIVTPLSQGRDPRSRTGRRQRLGPLKTTVLGSHRQLPFVCRSLGRSDAFPGAIQYATFSVSLKTINAATLGWFPNLYWEGCNGQGMAEEKRRCSGFTVFKHQKSHFTAVVDLSLSSGRIYRLILSGLRPHPSL